GALFQAPRDFVATKMRAFEWPAVSAPLAGLPANLVFPGPVGKRIWYDAHAATIFFDGFMTGEEKTQLLGLSADAPYQTAIQQLCAAPATVPLDAEQAFLGAADGSPLFDADETTPTDRFAYVLQRLLDHQRTTASTRLAIRRLGEVLKISSRVMEGLL